MVPYFSRTGTIRNLEAARAAGWGILISAAGRWNDHGFTEIGADNGQWEERGDREAPFKADRFLRFLDWLGDRARWLVVPDIVCGGLASLDLTLTWLERLRGHPSILLIAVQDGMSPAMIAPFLGPRVGLFVGGGDEFKEKSLKGWGELARETGCYLHVGRVNSVRRIFLCAGAGAHSFDGTSATRYAVNLPRLDSARGQVDLAPRMAVPSAHTPAGFARRCREIVATMPGHAAHRELDLLTNEILAGLGFAEGVRLFEAAVRDWHRDGLPYPLPQTEAA